jgi:LAO/AO transport system kinase
VPDQPQPGPGPAAARDPAALAAALRGGDRRALARAITLVESTRPADRAAALALLDALKGAGESLRIGLSGTPGVGKSTFIEALGLRLAEAGHRVAVLAVDPSSARSGGSILGDKTRMERLARHPRVFIRPSPARATLGGVARRTREAIRLCEAAGFDLILVETVGVGQSETMVAEMTDIFVLLLGPGGGDELQGVKRGIMEIADLVLVNKADGALGDVARRTCADYAGALRLMRRRPQDPEGFPAAMTVSAVEGSGLAEAWEAVQRLAGWRRETGHLRAIRARQAAAAFAAEVRAGLLAPLEEDPAARRLMERMGARVAAGDLSAVQAAAAVLARLGRAPDGADESLDAAADCP